MRPLALLLPALLLAPLAAATITLPQGPRLEMPLRAGEAHAFEVPFTTSGGEVYAKIVPTQGNAAHDGERANGTLDPPAGWWVAFSLTQPEGERVDLGARVDGTPTERVPLAAESNATLGVVVHAPPDAAAPARVYVAIARAAEGAASGSGAQQDEARAITLTLTAAEAPSRAATPGFAPAALGLALAVALTLARRR